LEGKERVFGGTRKTESGGLEEKWDIFTEMMESVFSLKHNFKEIKRVKGSRTSRRKREMPILL